MDWALNISPRRRPKFHFGPKRHLKGTTDYTDYTDFADSPG